MYKKSKSYIVVLEPNRSDVAFAANVDDWIGILKALSAARCALGEGGEQWFKTSIQTGQFLNEWAADYEVAFFEKGK